MALSCDSRHGEAAVRRARKLWGVQGQRQVVEFALQRRAVLAAVSSGKTRVDEVCDAGVYLLRAARFHGRLSELTCPICRKEPVTLVSWVFGEGLGQVSGSARTADELERLAASQDEFSVHDVEVCRTCRWNHLVRSYVLGAVPRPRQRRQRRTASE